MSDPTSSPPSNPPQTSTTTPLPAQTTEFPTVPIADTASTLSPLPPSPAALATEPESVPETAALPSHGDGAKEPAPEAVFEHVTAPGGAEAEDVEMETEGAEVKPLAGPPTVGEGAADEGEGQAEEVPFGGEVSPERDALALPTTDQSLLHPAMDQDNPPTPAPQPDQLVPPAQSSDPSPIPPADPPSAPSPAQASQPELQSAPVPAPPAPEPTAIDLTPAPASTPSPAPAPALAPDVVIVDPAPQPPAVPAPTKDPYTDPTSPAAQAALAASQWNGLLHWTRKSRGPQWDWATGM